MTTRDTEFVATLGFPRDAILGIHEVAVRFEDALIEVISEHPAISEYFVQAFDEMHEVHVGLRFNGVDPDLVEDWASDVITDTFERFRQSRGLGTAANLRREDSGLVVA